ncbi:sugar phosphate nucleotidyltransferase [Jeotgalibacillus proteolyticus]|uniref:Glucose-1-phosphate adenylyltransferase n=1 Tax=Jeotgalibacillus proteolyticus TaxID=2082395 RepID=A0A2S5G7R9_9BACL|nr:sugar phosphate nucleotidyltransferase [Jeotgalibacillus proteolyticus]PPA68971.1 glucose-1-phosphate adenylyltransferase [Jeotgalibacillus proteolyticus]
MSRLLGVIDATNVINGLQDLSLNRSVASIPFAGRYRFIDFILSNMVNSGVDSIAIFPKHQYRSLMDHIGSGKNWDLDRKKDGLFFFPPYFEPNENSTVGSFARFEQHLDYFKRSHQDYVFIANSYVITNIDIEEALAEHLIHDHDITELVNHSQSLDMYILKKSLLIDLIEDRKNSQFISVADVVTQPLHNYKIGSYQHNGYTATMDSIEAYYRHSMKLLDASVWNQLFPTDRPVFTKVKDEPPTRYSTDAIVTNSMVANGAVIKGKVDASIISRAVKIGKGSHVTNCIVMQKSQIGEGCTLEHVILDKDVRVLDGVTLKGSPDKPLVLRKGTVREMAVSM